MSLLRRLRLLPMRVTWFAATALAAAAAVAQTREIPALTGPVMDQGRFLSEQAEAQLAAQLKSYLPKVQIQVWTVGDLGGEDIASLAYRAASSWKLGTEGLNNGVLILVSRTERRARVEVGRGLEGVLPDIQAARWIDHILVPAFRMGEFEAGLAAVSQQVALAAGVEGVKSQDTFGKSASTKSKKLSGSWFMALFFGVALLRVFKARWLRLIFATGIGVGAAFFVGVVGGLIVFLGLLVFALMPASAHGAIPWAMGGRYRGGWGGGGFGGGGWSGGGGSFGGGGASGSW